jgi:broad specificity phosphatase PhoE
MLEGFFKNELETPVRVLTSTLRRAITTSEKTGMPVFQVKNLDEINVGVCDGMTYKEIEERYPFENQERNANKLSYRYPRGESYLDLISRLEPIIFEMERSHEPIVIIAH